MNKFNPFSTSNERITALDTTLPFDERDAAIKRLALKNYTQGALFIAIGIVVMDKIQNHRNQKNES